MLAYLFPVGQRLALLYEASRHGVWLRQSGSAASLLLAV
jgi:hypothetical protein